MIIIKLSGGLGNQMFQFATGLSIAQENGFQLKIDISSFKKTNSCDTPREFALDKFDFKFLQASESEIEIIRFPLGGMSRIISLIKKMIIRQHMLDYHPGIFRVKDNKYLDGYFQSEKNFFKYSKIVRQVFSLRKEYLNQIPKAISDRFISAESISIHIRRGDYAQDKKTNKYHGLCSLSYYEGAISLITSKVKNPHFFIFSDDLEWVKKNLPINHPHTFVSDGVLIPQQEMYLMSKCKHNIIANSTFSWWGAWLNENPDKIVIAPKKWVNIEPNPHPNIIPETWITI